MSNNPIMLRPSDSDLVLIDFLKSYLSDLYGKRVTNTDVLRYALSCAFMETKSDGGIK